VAVLTADGVGGDLAAVALAVGVAEAVAVVLAASAAAALAVAEPAEVGSVFSFVTWWSCLNNRPEEKRTV
jgi:hypothetical protein